MVRLKRLKQNLLKLGLIGKTLKGGVTRGTGTQEDKKARDFIVRHMENAGLEVRVDKIGNIFGRKEGTSSKNIVMTGSHIDSVPNGGIYDGSLGVLMSLEAVSTIEEEGFKNERPIEVVVFSDEEGRFHPHLGSKVITKTIDIKKAWRIQDKTGITVEESLENIGYRGDFERSIKEVEFYIESHIEQGPVLYNKKIRLGIVKNVAGFTWLDLIVQGQENHAGATPMQMRKDALVAGSEIALFVNERANNIATELDSSLVGTVGRMSVAPNAINVVPGKVVMGVDIRSIVFANIRKLANDIVEEAKKTEDKYGVDIRVKKIASIKPIAFSDYVIENIRKVCTQLNMSYILMNSGAAHDAQEMAQKTKAGMIFVPSVEGISHSPEEKIEWKDVESGTRVLVQVLKNLSK